uniref:Uncharacterized protein n=1 Tax=Candidatus Kentrum eta TaxID=2126337 RepID=A0A450VRZ7_9GAMM|nr:MAG: hypothetical protein BECKH772A_GA0070896_104253 [Candidatus Kentron sp. H]VFK04628.1 MAG: hypothetical protein BECKH772B_GA0070898_104673 [Candidatus Kentron sp. H]VFK07552.1 MAG: hypothetical protein BECKH772C_GA0070978_104313 [Candidatus Kentron sp. H]
MDRPLVVPSEWIHTPAPEHTLVFLSGDSATFGAELSNDGDRKYFFYTAASAMKRRQQNGRSRKGVVIYGQGVNHEFQEYKPGNSPAPPSEYGSTQDLEQALNSGLSILPRTTTTGGENNHPCGNNFRLIYMGYAPSLSIDKVPETFTSVDVITSVGASPEQIPASSRFNVHIVGSGQEIIRQLNALLPVSGG